MSLLAEAARQSLLAFAAILFVLQIVAREVGYAIGRRQARAEASLEGVGVAVTSMLGLLAFVLGLTLAYANTRFQERRLGTLSEAQSIGTSWLRAQTVGQAQGQELARLLEDYTRIRIEFIRLPADSDAVAVEQRTSALQSQIWEQVVDLGRARTDPVLVSLVVSLNETFDLAMAQRFAFTSGPAAQFRARPPISESALRLRLQGRDSPAAGGAVACRDDRH